MGAPSTKVTSFDLIESDKENVVPLKHGRAASRLSDALSQDEVQLNEVKVKFEQRLMQELEDMDDPLELFLEYFEWINSAYPQGGTSRQSPLLDVIERCLHYFKDIETYKNDPRFLRVWLWYLELSAPASLSEAKDIFVFMYRKQIGAKLTLFYEEFSSLLFEMDLVKDAYGILQAGIEVNARPQNRLKKTIRQFELKMESMGINIENLPSSLPGFLRNPEFETRTSVLGREQAGIQRSQEIEQKSQKSRKFEVFQDTNEDKPNEDDLKYEGWDVLDSKWSRSKENQQPKGVLESGSNIGKLVQEEKLDQQRKSKISIFKDDIGRTDPIYKIIEIPGRKPEKIDCNFNLLYHTDGKEYCIEEILALARNVYHKIKAVDTHLERTLQETKRRKTALTQKRKALPPSQPPIPLEDETYETQEHSPEVEYKSVTKTTILPLNDEQTTTVTNLKVSQDERTAPSSPTITFFSKDAMNDVFSMFNQNYQEEIQDFHEQEDTTSRFSAFENATQEFTKPNMDDLTEVKVIENGREYNTNLQKTPIKVATGVADAQRKVSDKTNSTSNQKEFMTPIQESFETSQANSKIISEDNSKPEGSLSSPFMSQPPGASQLPNAKIRRNPLTINDPLNKNLRHQLLSNLQTPLKEYETFYQYPQALNKSTLLKKILKQTVKGDKNPLIEFKDTGHLYFIRTELGQGGYATVYLAESNVGKLRALKVEKPATVWEYYILKQLEKRLANSRALTSIINASSVHCFQDESYLVLNYARQGTILDLVNLQKEKTQSSLDETLCMFLTVELMKVVESIHSVGIIHGDLKPDNCMLRFERGELGAYEKDGSNGWKNKGIYLIDFGRSFDMRLYPENTKFIANWKTDQQDCPEMRMGKPWSYEADYYGLAGIIHAMLFGKFIEVVEHQNGSLKLKNSFKRYWQQDIWSSLFDTLINSSNNRVLPVTASVRELRLKMENYLLINASDRLRRIIVDLEPAIAQFEK